MTTNLKPDQLSYPIGRMIDPTHYTKELRREWIRSIEQFPRLLKDEVILLDSVQLDWNYRPGGWNIKQLIHHCADAHLTAFMRFKMTLAECKPTVKPYDEELASQSADVLKAPIYYSLQIIEGIHERWAVLLKNMKPEDFDRKFYHPEYDEVQTLNKSLYHYAWHGEHHLAQIKQALDFRGCFCELDSCA